jgi:hypothetical protein
MPLDLNDAGPQRSFDVIPDGTICTVGMTIRAGNAGDGGWLKRAKDGNSEALDCEFVVQDGEFAKRKFWTLMLVAGTTEGHGEAANITKSRLRAILESARGVRPDDKSDAAKEARRINSYGDLDGLCFIACIGVDPPRGEYKAKNRLDRAITPDEVAWHPVTQAPQGPKPHAASAKPATAPAAIGRPQWAS